MVEVTEADIELAERIISGVRGFGVKISPNHSAAQWIAAHAADTRAKVIAWLPIETAPKDGTWVLLSGGDIGENGRPMVVGQFEDFHKIWIYLTDDDGFVWQYRNPTHWQPLPAPPAKLGEQS